MKYGITNAKGKSGGGGAELNIEYGLTPPSNTDKIWVKCNEPAKVKVEYNRNLTISSNGNAKQVSQSTITKTYIANYSLNPLMYKVGSDYYMANGPDFASYFMNNGLSLKKVCKYSNDTFSIACEPPSTQRFCNALFKYDETHAINVGSDSIVYICDVVNGTYVLESDLSNGAISNLNFAGASCFDGENLYAYIVDSSNNLIIGRHKINGGNTRWSLSTSIIENFLKPSDPRWRCAYSNGALYFLLYGGLSLSQNDAYLCKWVIGSNSFSIITKLPRINENGSMRCILNCTLLTYQDKLYICNMSYTETGGETYVDYIYLVDLTNETIDKIEVGRLYSRAYVCIDESTGNLEIWGGQYPTTAQTQKSVISNIYELEENTLELYYNTGSTLNITLIDTPTLTMKAPINYAWLGDSNDLAQKVDMYYYDNGTWKGINCDDYSE